MLVLTRRPAESIMVGDDVKVTVLGFGGGQQVKFGIDAPPGMPVHRKEVWDRIRAGSATRVHVLPEPRMVHELKIHPKPFHLILRGSKRHEVRKLDRDYQEGDHVILRELTAPGSSTFTGRELEFRIGSVTTGWGLPEGLCVFTLLEAPPARRNEVAS